MAIAEVLKFESNSNIFAWKYPNSELATWTQLIVHESQEAVLVKNGQVADIFGSGHYSLSTDNIPILQGLINIPFGKKSPFSAEVWFINKAFSLDIKWGTVTPIQIQDPKYNIFVPARAFGQFGIKIEDSKKFLLKLVGTMKFFNKDTLTEYFKGLYITRVKDYISACLVKSKISILEINAHLNEISTELQNSLSGTLEEYGISLVSFYVNDINIPEDDPSVNQLKSALAKKAEMDIIGYNYQQERTFDTLESAAENQSNNTVMGSAIGMGMGFGIGGAIGAQAQNMAENLNTNSKMIECPACKQKVNAGSKFCPSCGKNLEEKPEQDIRCSKCGCTISVTTKFCPECGNKCNLCTSCNTDIPDGVYTCPKCGKSIPKNCPECGKQLDRNAKFCDNCGYSFIKKCSCGAVLNDGTKFCPECGNQV